MSRRKKKQGAKPGHKGGSAPGKAEAAPMTQAEFGQRFVLRTMAWLPLTAAIWFALVSPYNLTLIRSTESVANLFESPNATRLTWFQKHSLLITRTDFPSARGHLNSIRVTDTHFPLIMMGAFFLATPGVSWRRRLIPLGWALAISGVVHVTSLYCQIQLVYANELGEWSAANYSGFERNFWGLTQHLLKLPVKFALPMILWAFFYVRLLLPQRS